MADVFRRYGDACRVESGASLSTAQRRVMTAIERCRTAALGGHVEQCDQCGHTARLVQLLSQSALSAVSIAGAGGLARSARAEILDCGILPRRLHRPRSDRRHRVAEQGRGLRHPFPGGRRDVTDDRRRSQASGCRDWLLRGPTHVGTDPRPSSPPALRRPRRRPVADGARWVACRPGFFLPVRVLSRLFRRLFLTHIEAAFEAGQLRFFGSLDRIARSRGASSISPRCARRTGSLRQTALRRPVTGARLRRAVHPSRRHLQYRDHGHR